MLNKYVYETPGLVYELDQWILVQPVCARMTLIGCVVSFCAQLLDKQTTLDQLRQINEVEKHYLRGWAINYLLQSPLRDQIGSNASAYFYAVRKSTQNDLVIGYQVVLLPPSLDLTALILGEIGDLYE